MPGKMLRSKAGCKGAIVRIAAARHRTEGRAVPFIKTESDRASSATSRHGCRCGEVRARRLSCRQYKWLPRPAPRSETLTGPRPSKTIFTAYWLGQQDQAGPSQLRTAATPIARLDRAHCQDSTIPADRPRTAHRRLLPAHLCTVAVPRTLGPP